MQRAALNTECMLLAAEFRIVQVHQSLPAHRARTNSPHRCAACHGGLQNTEFLQLAEGRWVEKHAPTQGSGRITAIEMRYAMTQTPQVYGCRNSRDPVTDDGNLQSHGHSSAVGSGCLV